ncbi:MAG: hypothetical protein FWE48_05380 [Coriobacteriia bacterium]|nr:hypothetical protein [Coriobacteriia bacterium]
MALTIPSTKCGNFIKPFAVSLQENGMIDYISYQPRNEEKKWEDINVVYFCNVTFPKCIISPHTKPILICFLDSERVHTLFMSSSLGEKLGFSIPSGITGNNWQECLDEFLEVLNELYYSD